jgi:CTP-dependent riboflavin kinase
VAASGVGKAAYFTRIPWVAHQFSRKLRLAPWPGTFNVRLTDPQNQSLWHEIQRLPGVEIDPPDASACVARCYPVRLNDVIRGAVVLPHVGGYPPDQIEIVAEENIRARLNLQNEDSVILEVFAGPVDGI